ITDGPQAHWGGFIAMVLFSGAFYGVFAFFREQVCTNVCPYGRLQGVLLDRNSVVVSYDHERGEGRGKLRKGQDREAQGLGDCIDCHQCVHVCPTGIDIRNGTQLECINCTACIDACDTIMDKINKPRGLVRYDSEAGIADRQPWRLTARAKAYSVVLVALIGVLISLLALRTDVETSLLRTPGMTYQVREDGRISNLYNVSLLNKTTEELPLRLELVSPEGEINWVGDGISTLAQQANVEGTLFMIIDKQHLNPMKTEVEVAVYSGEELIKTVKTNFMGPF
ncbi:MAG: 4Fe-4S dicluster domain-containing protein, partial [Bacteroidota bacterium]